MSWPRLQVAGVFLLFIGFTLDIAGLTTTEWSTFGQPKNYIGLFRVCLNHGRHFLCVDWASRSPGPELYGVWVLLIGGVLSGACATVVTLCKQLLARRKQFERRLALVVLTSATTSGALTVSGIVLYALRIHNAIYEDGFNVKFGYSFFLTFSSSIFTTIGGVVVFVGYLLRHRPIGRRRRPSSSAADGEATPLDNVEITGSGPQPPMYEFESTENSPPKYQNSWRSPRQARPTSHSELRQSEPQIFCISAGTEQSGAQVSTETVGQIHEDIVGCLESPPSYEEATRQARRDMDL